MPPIAIETPSTKLLLHDVKTLIMTSDGHFFTVDGSGKIKDATPFLQCSNVQNRDEGIFPWQQQLDVSNTFARRALKTFILLSHKI